MERLQRLGRHLGEGAGGRGKSAVSMNATGCGTGAAESMEPRRLLGKVAIVTGAGNGIGEAVSKLFALHGAKLVCVDLKEQDVQRTVDDINEQFPGCAVALKADISSTEENKKMCQLAVKKFGKLDVFVANAGILPPFGPIEDEDESLFKKVMDINTFGVFQAIKYGSKAMKETAGGGTVIATSSIASIRSDLTPFAYAASKSGVNALIIAANDRLLLDNVRVNGVMPGGVMTELMMSVAENLRKQNLELRGYDGRRFPTISTEEIAKTYLFLASDDSASIKGQVIVVDGGASNSMGSQPYPRKMKTK